jgi:hypothetical protein
MVKIITENILYNLKEDYDTSPAETIVLEDLTYLAQLDEDTTKYLFVDNKGKYYLVRLYLGNLELVRGNTYNVTTRHSYYYVNDNSEVVDTVYQARLIERESPEVINKRREEKKEARRLANNERARQKRLKKKEVLSKEDVTRNGEPIEKPNIDSILEKVLNSVKAYHTVINDAEDEWAGDNEGKDSDRFYDDDIAYNKAVNTAFDEFAWIRKVIPELQDEDRYTDFVYEVTDAGNDEAVKKVLNKYIN